MTPHPLSAGTLLLIVAVFVWAMVRRMRRAIGLQPLQVNSLRIKTIFLAMAAVLLLVATAHQRLTLVAESAGLLVGGALAVVGLRLTQFEEVGKQRYYRPNLYLGIGLVVLFIVRIGYRFMLYRAGALDRNALTGSSAAFGSSPLTSCLMLATLSYYVFFYAGLLRKAAAPAEVSPA